MNGMHICEVCKIEYYDDVNRAKKLCGDHLYEEYKRRFKEQREQRKLNEQK